MDGQLAAPCAVLATGGDLITVGQGCALSLEFLLGSSLATGPTCVALCGLFASLEAHSTVNVTLSVTARFSVEVLWTQ